MNKIKLLLTKSPALGEEFQFYQVFVGLGNIMIQYSIYNNVFIFCKRFNLKTKNI